MSLKRRDKLVKRVLNVIKSQDLLSHSRSLSLQGASVFSGVSFLLAVNVITVRLWSTEIFRGRGGTSGLFVGVVSMRLFGGEDSSELEPSWAVVDKLTEKRVR